MQRTARKRRGTLLFLCLCIGLCAEIARTIARFWATSGAASAMGEGVEKNTRQIHIFGVKKL
jgi:hypothetical protein